jgi:hypothetical protein
MTVDRAGVTRDGRQLLVDAVWRSHAVPDVDQEVLQAALTPAYANGVQGRLARVYPGRLDAVVRETAARTDAFRGNLADSTQRLWSRGVRAVLIKAEPVGDCVYPNFDLVVPPHVWPVAVDVLRQWAQRRETYWLERSTKELFWPVRGPGAHLHSAVTWFGIDVVPAEQLYRESEQRQGQTWLTPCPEDQLRIWLAHALFQNLCFDLSELLALRALLGDDVVAVAGGRAVEEGWPKAFTAAVDLVRSSVARLDQGDVLPLPLPVPPELAVSVAVEHALHNGRTGRRGACVREIALRGPLLLAKRRRAATT